MAGRFYDKGRQDALTRTIANPITAGAATPQDYNEYMNGYNSVQFLPSNFPTRPSPTKPKTIEDLLHFKEKEE
jgi:hypothetical protein